MCLKSGDGVCFTRITESNIIYIHFKANWDQKYNEYFSKGGATLRGCAATLTPTQLTDCRNNVGRLCTLCTGSSCNVAIHPENHLKCYKCSGTNCSKPQSGNENLLFCRNQVLGDQCVEIRQNNTSK